MNYLSAEALGIEEWERTRLIEAVDLLAILPDAEEADKEDSFNISIGCAPPVTSGEYKCGSVACIGGWVHLLENPKDFVGADKYVVESEFGVLESLYYPDLEDWSGITAKVASKTVDHFLQTGKIDFTQFIEE